MEATARVITEHEMKLLTGLYPAMISPDTPMYTRTMVFILNGAGANGKDTFVARLSNSDIMAEYAIVAHISSVDRVYDAISALLGTVHYEKTNEWRTLMAKVKSAWLEYDDGPYHYVMDKIMEHYANHRNRESYLFIDIREPNEINRVRTECMNRGIPCFTVYVHGLNAPENYTNSSDRNVESYTYDFVIHNIPDDYEYLDREIELFALWAKQARYLLGNMLYGDNIPSSIRVADIDVPKD